MARGPSKPSAPISKAMRDGKEPLRTFGDLKQFLESRSNEDEAGGEAERPTGG